MKKSITTILTLFLLIGSVFAKNDEGHLIISTKGTLNNNISRNPNQGNYILQSTNRIFGEIGVGYKHLWNNKLGIKTSLNAGALPAAFTYNFANYFYTSTINQWYISLSALFVKQFNITEKHAIGVNLGLKETWVIPPTYNTMYYNALILNATGNTNISVTISQPSKRFFTSLVFVPEYIYTFENKNYIAFGIELSYSSAKLFDDINTYYNVANTNNGSHESGNFEMGINYIGLNIELGF